MQEDKDKQAEERMAALLRHYLHELEAAFPRWWDYWARLRATPEDGETLQRFYREIHRLKGSAGSYGLWELSHWAAELEAHLEAIVAGRVLLTKSVWEKVSALLSKLELGFLAAVREHQPEARGGLRGSAEGGLSPNRVLCVDDDPAWLRLLRAHLEELDFEVRTLLDPTRALDVLREFRPRFLVLDWDMPGMDGLELCRRVRADRAFEGMVIVLVTAREDLPTPEECARAGITVLCSKLLGPVGVATRLRLGIHPADSLLPGVFPWEN